jgi:hypothetical protein
VDIVERGVFVVYVYDDVVLCGGGSNNDSC